MREIARIYQNRRDFKADYECESCKFVEKKVKGYDDSFFHTSVIPNSICKKCGESTVSLKEQIIDKTIIPPHATI